MRWGKVSLALAVLVFSGAAIRADPLPAEAKKAEDEKQDAKKAKNADDGKKSDDRKKDSAATEPEVGGQYTERLVVSPTRRESDPLEIPYTVDVLTGKEIRIRKASRTIPEAFREIPSVLVQKTAHGQGSPFIRGFTGFHTLFTIDGIRLNHSAFRSGPNQYWATVNPLEVDRLEIVKGPSSVMYGSEAVGGTVNMITPAAYTARDGWSFTPQLYYRYAHATDANVGSFSLSGGDGKRFGFLGGVSLRDFGDVEAGSGLGEQPNTGYEATAGNLKVEYLVGSNGKLVASYQTLRQQDVPRTHKTIYARSFEGTRVGNERRRDLDQRRDLSYLQFHVEQLAPGIDRAKFSLSLQRHEEERDRLRSAGSGGDVQGFDLSTTGFWAQLESDTTIGNLVYGFDLYHDEVDSFKHRFDEDGGLTGVGVQGSVADDSTYDLLGLYVQDQKSLGKGFTLTAGLRYTYAAVDAGRVDVEGEEASFEDSWDDLAGNVGLVWSTRESWAAFVRVSRAFRAPNLSDLTKLDDTSAVELPSLELAPEHFLSFEVGGKARHGRWAGQAAYWYTKIDDMIVQSPTGDVIDGTPVVSKDNIGDGFVHGVEFEGNTRLSGRWSLFGNFTWMDGEVDQLDESSGFTIVRAPLSRLMPTSLVLGARYQLGKAWIEGLVTAVARQDRLALRDATDTSRIPPGGTPGYSVYTVRSAITLTQSITLAAGIENLTNENYRVHGSGLNEPGFNFVVTVDAIF